MFLGIDIDETSLGGATVGTNIRMRKSSEAHLVLAGHGMQKAKCEALVIQGKPLRCCQVEHVTRGQRSATAAVPLIELQEEAFHIVERFHAPVDMRGWPSLNPQRA